METFGYYGRFWSHQSPHDFGAYSLQFLLILVAPIFLAATIYMSLGRIIQALHADKLAAIRPKWRTKLFIFFDIICFLVQMAGAGMQITTSESMRSTGRIVVIIGLVAQVLVFGIFILIAWRFNANFKKEEITDSHLLPWKRYMRTLFGVSCCILLRNFIRIIEYAQGHDGALVKYEAFIYVFDALPMLLVASLMLVIHPGRLQRASKRSALPLAAATGGDAEKSKDVPSRDLLE